MATADPHPSPEPEPVPVIVSGDGFITLADGSMRWGRFGAAGVLVRCAGDDGAWHYFLARRSEFCHQGGMWAVPGGALNEGEAPVSGALREFSEEIGLALTGFSVVDIHEDDHGGWSYWTVVVELSERFGPPVAVNWETAETAWIAGHRLAELELLEPFRLTLARLGLL
ncbi:MAG TPA: NUDIX domain-containing protein [Acidimicrobiia bacterium]|nr:NUDIX domain-containing protein [Acidimicrobiia bacterium]